MKILIAVKSCRVDQSYGCHDAIRNTWGKDIENLFFFMGKQAGDFNRQNDEVRLSDVEDDYDHLPQKTRAILNFSLWNHFDYTFLCDVDTFLIPKKLLLCDFEVYDYSGRFGSEPKIGTTFRFRDGRRQIHHNCHPWASGGFGYFLSRKATEIVSKTEPTMWAEDMYVGNTLGPGIQSGNVTAGDLIGFENEASWHYPAHQLGWSRERMKLWMHEMYGDHFNDR